MRLLATLLLAASLATGHVVAAEKPAQAAGFFIEDVSAKEFHATLQALDNAIKEAKWSVLSAHRMHENMAERGHKIGRMTILEVCSLKHALVILKDDNKKMVSSMMPCRISVYETADGRVIVSRLNADGFAGMMQAGAPELAEIMRQAGGDMERIIAKALAK